MACAAAIASLELFEENKIIESLPAKMSRSNLILCAWQRA
jgi:hypothetical protein